MPKSNNAISDVINTLRTQCKNNTTWSNTHDARNLLEIIEQHLSTLSADEAANILFSFSKLKMDIKFEHTEGLCLKLMNVVALANPVTDWQLVNTLLAGSKLKIKWYDLEKMGIAQALLSELQNKIALPKQRHWYAQKYIASLINCFGKYQLTDSVHADLMNDLLHIAFLRRFEFNHIEYSQILLGLAQLGFKWQDFHYKFQDAVTGFITHNLECITDQSLLNIFWSAAVMDMPLSPPLNQQLLSALTPIIEKHAGIMLNAKKDIYVRSRMFEMSKLVLTQVQQVSLNYSLFFPENIGTLLEKALIRAMPKIEEEYPDTHRFQADVTQKIERAIKDKGIEMQLEASPLLFKPVDILFPKLKIILEIDGVHHRNKDKQLRPKDAFNESLSTKHGFKTVRIRQEKIQKRFGKNAQEEYIVTKLLKFGILKQAPADLNHDKTEKGMSPN